MADEVYDGAIGIDLGMHLIEPPHVMQKLTRLRNDIFLRRQL